MKKIFLIIPLILLLAGGVILLKKRRHAVSQAPTPREQLHTVRAVQPTTGTVATRSGFLARVQAINRAEISSKLSGRILELPVQESMEVHKGDLLVRIDDRELRAGIKGLQAQLQAARDRFHYVQGRYERDQVLFKAGGLAREKLEASQVDAASARGQVRDLEEKIRAQEAQLNYLEIKAPFDGRVGTILLRPGSLAVPGKPILFLHSAERKLTFGFVPANHGIRPGQEVLDGETNTLLGRVNTLYSDADKGLTVAEVRLEHPLDLPDNAFVNIMVTENSLEGCVVPVRGLLHRKGQTSVMVGNRDRFTELPITVLAEDTQSALVEPCPQGAVAVAVEARLSLLPAWGKVKIIPGQAHE